MMGAIFLLEILACLAIAVRAIDCVRKMSSCTKRPIFIAWVVIGGSAAQVAADIMRGHAVPNMYSAILLLAVAALVWIDRRRSR